MTRRALRLTAFGACGVLLLGALLGSAALLVGNTDAGRGWIERLTSSLTGGHVQLVGLRGAFPAHLTLDRLQLRDDRGVWLTAERISVDWSPAALLARRIRIEVLAVGRLHMERLPISAAPASGKRASIPHIDVESLAAEVVELGAPLAGAPVSMALTGSLRLTSLEEATANLAARRLDGDGRYLLTARIDSKRIDASLDVHEPAGGPLQNLLGLPGLGALSAEARAHGPRRDVRVDLGLSAGESRARAAGGLDLVAGSADVGFSLESPALVLRPGLSWRHLGLRGRWRGTLAAASGNAQLDAEDLAVPGSAAMASLHAAATAAAGKLTVHGVAEGVQIPGPAPKLLQADPLTIDASIDFNDGSRPVTLAAAHRLFSLQAQSALTGPLAATMELHLPDVAPLAVLAAQDARGAATFKAQLSRDGAETQWSLDADAAFTGGKAVWVAALGDRATLQLTGTLNDRGLDLDQLHLGGRALQLSLNGSATRAPAGAAAIKDLHARWALSVTDLSALSPLLAGELNASGQLSGPAAALSAEAQLSSTLSVRGSPSGTVSASLTVRGLPATPSGTLRAAGMLDGAPLDVDVELERPGGREMRAAKAKADWKSAHLEGEATFANSLAESQGQLRLQIGALGDLSRLLGLELRGAAGGSVDFKPASGHTEAQIRFAATNLVAGSVAGNLQLSGAGTAEALALQFGLQMPALHGAPASLSGQARLDLDTRQLRVDTLLGEYRGESLHLESPAAISFADGLSLEPVKLADQQSFLSLEGRLAPTLDLRAALHLPGPAVINALRPQLLASGAFEADAELHGTLSAPSGSVHVNGTGIRSVDQEANELPPVNVHAAAQLAGDSGTLDAKIDAGAASTLAVTGTFPLGADGALGLKIAGALDVGLINPVLEAGGQHAAGDLSVDATVNGTPSAPQIGGTIRLAKGSLRDYQLGLNLSNISAEVFGTQAMLQIKTFTASAASGNLAVTGTFGVLQPGMPLDLKITAKNAEPIVSKIVTANLNADVRINGTLREHLDVTGAIHLNKTTIGIPDALPPDVAVLDVRRRGTGAPAPAAKPLVIALDLALQAPQQMLLAGRGLNAELGGEVHIAGTTDDPVVTGGFDLQRGSFSLASSRLNFTAGRVSFDGAGLRNKIDPTLDFTAETAVSNGSSTATVTLRITGLADAPRFDFTSSPSLPQDEIMAELLFGESPAQLSALQVAEIGAALATLSGVGDNGVNPLSKLQKTLGLDRLAVGTASTGTTPGAANQGTSIEAGRYVTKHVYVEAKQTTTGVSQVQVDVDLTNHLKLQTRLGNGTAIVQGTTPENDPGSSVGLSYQFEY